MRHAIVSLENELTVLRDCRRRLILNTAGEMTGAERAAYLQSSTHEIADVELGLAVLRKAWALRGQASSLAPSGHARAHEKRIAEGRS